MAQNDIEVYMAGKKTLSTKLQKLQLPKEGGGWGLPSLKNYYISAQIRSLLWWCNPSYEAQWKDIECRMITVVHIGCTIG